METLYINSQSDISEYIDIVEIRTRNVNSYQIRIIKHFNPSFAPIDNIKEHIKKKEKDFSIFALDYDKIKGRKLVIKDSENGEDVIVEDEEGELAGLLKGVKKDVQISYSTDTILVLGMNCICESFFQSYKNDSITIKAINQMCSYVEKNGIGTVVKGSY
ncbi:MAG: hypothetical protein GX219_04055 [Tissierellia bacterium]|nr:hypothetical protein [Tissierellia bacterium]